MGMHTVVTALGSGACPELEETADLVLDCSKSGSFFLCTYSPLSHCIAAFP